jgi:hypothetical protein
MRGTKSRIIRKPHRRLVRRSPFGRLGVAAIHRLIFERSPGYHSWAAVCKKDQLIKRLIGP